MAITVARGVVDRIVKFPGSISLQVRGATDVEAAARALRDAVEDIKRLGSNSFTPGGDALTPNFTGGVVTVPAGPFITLIDAPMVPRSERAQIPDIVARHLLDAGVTDAVIALTPKSGPLDELERTPRLVMLRLYPPHVDGPLTTPARPWSWVEEAWRWLAEHVGDGVVHVSASGAQFPLPAPDVAQFLERYREAGSCLLVGGDLGSRVWGVNLGANVALGFGGPAANDDELVATGTSFVDIARRLAPEVAQAYVSLEDRLAFFSALSHGTEWYGSGGEDPINVESFSDELCFEAFPYQVLGPGHLRRLSAGGDEGRLSRLVRPLEGGRVELAIGELTAWLRNSPDRPRLLQEARDMLAPCLTRGEATVKLQELLTARRQQRGGETPQAGAKGPRS